jgi:hypothetical protein
MLGLFGGMCGPEARNSGIRGLPPGFDLTAAVRSLLARQPGRLTSELDEQGLQVAVVSQDGPPLVVRLDEVTICSPFWPLLPHLGTCGAHFVGLNAKRLPWEYGGRPASEAMRELFASHRAELHRPTGAPTREEVRRAGPCAAEAAGDATLRSR